MSTSLSLVLKHLDLAQQSGIINDIVSHLKKNADFETHEVYINTFCQLLASSPDLREKYADFVYTYSLSILQSENPASYFGYILNLSLKIEGVAEKLIDYVVERLSIYVITNPRHFNEALINITNVSSNYGRDYDLSNTLILNLLKFTEWYFISNEDFAKACLNIQLDQLCFIFLTNEELKISKATYKIVKWRMASICQTSQTTSFLWKVIFLLGQSNKNTEISFGYTLWLRYFSHFTPEGLKTNDEFQSIISKEQYWYFLRDGLISLSHEHKKFALTLIQFSVQSLHTDLSTAIIKWDCEKETQYVESWKRFCTLYEILGIDAAMNQAQAAVNDLLKIFAPDSNIPVAFSLTILSVGFKASMDRIKNFALTLTFNLPKNSLSLFKNDFKFISQIFLPFTMKSSHFRVRKTSDGNYYCEFGERIRQFICNCVDSLDESDDISKLVGSIFDVLSENRLTFGIARIYIAWGVLKGLEKKSFKSLNASVLEKLLPLFETDAEGAILKTTLQTIHLKLLLQVNPTVVDARSIFGAVVYFIQFNSFQLYVENEEFFLDYLNTNFDQSSIYNIIADANSETSVDEFLVVTSYLLSNKIAAAQLAPFVLSHPRCSELLVRMAASGLYFEAFWTEHLIVSKVERLVGEMVVGSKNLDISIYGSSAKLFRNEKLFSEEFWSSVNLDPFFNNVSTSLAEVDNLQESLFYIAQFDFLSRCLPRCVFNEEFNISLESLMKLSTDALKNIPKGSDKDFYKAKDKLVSLILNNIIQSFKINNFDQSFRERVLEFADKVVSMSEYNSHKSNVNLLTHFLQSCNNKNTFTDSESKQISIILKNIWDELVRDRLILSQRDLHQAFVELVLNEKLLIKSTNDEELANSLYGILEDVIDNCSGRKGIMPCLLRAISSYQIKEPQFFEKTLWLSKLLVKASFLFQSELNIFQLDCIVSQEFDDCLNITGLPLYNSAYGDPEISYRATLFAIVGAIKTHGFAVEIWNFIFDNEKMFHFINPKKRTDREAQWKRIQFLSLFVATCEVLETTELVYFMQKFLVPRLFKEASPLCRTYIEWLICLTIIRAPEFREFVFDSFKNGIDVQQPLVIVTFERISILTSSQLALKEQIEFLTKFVVDVIIPLSSSNRSLIRHFSTSMACLIYNQIEEKKLDFPPLLTETLAKIYDVAHSMDDGCGYRVGDAILWNIKDDMNLVNITGGLLLKTTDREIDAIYQKDYSQYLNQTQKAILRVPIGVDETDKWIAGERNSEVKVDSYYVTSEEENQESSLLQTKSGVWSTVMDLDEDSRAAAQVKRSPLIVVSSLVDKAPNLGGICRLCDVLGAGWMTVHDIKVKEDPEFKSVAVTADRWMPLMEVKMEDIIEFMRLKKKEGYSLIGLEQTDKSVELNNDLKFPEKSLILLGKEREGIPGDLLAELDMCVIIKQVGIVRSMNIQTATAVIVHAYSAQHC